MKLPISKLCPLLLILSLPLRLHSHCELQAEFHSSSKDLEVYLFATDFPSSPGEDLLQIDVPRIKDFSA